VRKHDGKRNREDRRPCVRDARREMRDEAACVQHWMVLRQ